MGKKIMIVDDNSDVRFSVIDGLKNLAAGYEFIEAGDGTECIKLLKEGNIPELILLDIMMPEMDGWAVSQEVKKNPLWAKIPIIYLTAKVDDISKGLGSATGVDYITKPFEIIDLKNRIDKILK